MRVYGQYKYMHNLKHSNNKHNLLSEDLEYFHCRKIVAL